MEFNFEDYLAGLRESLKTDRERDLEGELQRIAKKHREALVAECEPIYKELAEIEARKPPLPIMVDGKMYEYVGPPRS
jgi:hypothetical protein